MVEQLGLQQAQTAYLLVEAKIEFVAISAALSTLFLHRKEDFRESVR